MLPHTLLFVSIQANQMQTNFAEKALLNLNSLNAANETTLEPQLFQILSNHIKISRFVAEVYAEMPEAAAIQLSWHATHLADDFSQYLGEMLVKALFTAAPNSIYDATVRYQQLNSEYQSEANVMRLLRQIRRQQSAAVAVLEMSQQITLEQAMTRMSILADGLIQVSYLWCFAIQSKTYGCPQMPLDDSASEGQVSTHANPIDLVEQPSAEPSFQNLMILAMGKFGGLELNFSSDIDLIFFYQAAGFTSGGRRTIENSRFFQKLGQQLIKLLDEKTADGFVFRVDMRLRPYGDSGSLVMSVDQAEDYYHEQGRGWERFAMVRSRIITGRTQEQFSLQQILKPFAFRRYIDYGVIDSLRNMKEMIQREVRRRGLKGNIKLGAGGIREIEFMVQSLQLIQGGRDKRLQQSNLLKVLPLLAEESLLPEDAAVELAKNYRFLRRLEHCLQQLEEKQTQQLPDCPQTQLVIAKLMGYEDWLGFNTYLEKITHSTNQQFNSLFGEDRNKAEQQDDFYLSLWEGVVSAEQLSEKLSLIELEDSQRLITMLNDFRESNAHVSLSQKGAKRLKLFFPTLLAIAMETDNPLSTIQSLIQILRSILKRTAYLDLLSENLPILQHLVDLVSRSQWIVDRLCESPILFDELLYPNSLYVPLQTSDLQSELQQSLLRIEETDKEQMLDTIRSFKQINELRVAAALLAQRLSISQVNRYLSQLAQVIVQMALNICWREMIARHGLPQAIAKQIEQVEVNQNRETEVGLQTGFAIVAYGKLGGNELGFNSDLDLVFLFDQPLNSETVGIPEILSNESSPVKPIAQQSENVKNKIGISRFYTRLAQKLVHFLSTRTNLGVLYEVDMRLRPSGNSGMLVSHVEAFQEYQQETAWTWEHQALVRARVVAGDLAVANRFTTIRNEILCNQRTTDKLKKDVVDMRVKMRSQLDQSAKQLFNIKQGVGGLVDIEFISQYLVLNSCYSLKSKIDNLVIPDSTVQILRFFKRENLISEQHCRALVDAFKSYINRLNELTLESGNKHVLVEEFEQQRSDVKRIWIELFEN